MTISIMYKGKAHIYKIDALTIRQIKNIIYFVDCNLSKIRVRFYNKHPIPLKALIKLTAIMSVNLTVLLDLNTYLNNTNKTIQVS